MWRPTRSILTFRQVRRKRTSWEKPLRVLIARRKPTSRSWCSFLAKVHGQSVLRHGQSFARNSRFQRTLGGSARTGHGLHLSRFGMTPFGLRASSRVRPTRKERRLDDRGRSEKGIGPPDHRAVPVPLLPFLPHVPSKAKEGGVTIHGRGIVTAQSGDGIDFALPDDSTLALVQPRCKLLRHGF